jgi:hypothetical protein
MKSRTGNQFVARFLRYHRVRPAGLSACHSTGLSVMTRNRTAIDMLAALGTQLTVVLLFVLACGLTFARYTSMARERMRRVEIRLRRRATRRATYE